MIPVPPQLNGSVINLPQLSLVHQQSSRSSHNTTHELQASRHGQGWLQGAPWCQVFQDHQDCRLRWRHFKQRHECGLSQLRGVHTSKIADYQLLAATKRETRNFILAVIEDTWVRKLREPVTLYTAISPSWLLVHLQVLRVGLHGLDVLALQN